MTKILHKRSSTIGSAPTTASIDLGELAINTTDGKLFLKKSGSIGESIEQAITTGASNEGTVNLTGSLILSPSSSTGAQNALDVTVQTLDFDFDTLAFNGTSSFTGPYSVTSSAIISGSLEVIGTTTLSGSLNVQSGITGSLFGTSSWAVNAQTASLAPNYVLTSVTSSMLAPYVLTSQTSSMSVASASVATSASYALTASFALNGGGGGTVNTGSLLTTASVSLNTITFTKGDGSTFPITVDTGSGGGGGAAFPFSGSAVISGSLFVSSSTTNVLTIQGSGSAQPIFTVQGSAGQLFAITDSLSGSLFSVNNVSGLPILEVFSDDTTLIGSYLAPALNTTARNTLTNSGSFTVYSMSTASYDGIFIEYTAKSGSNARAGNIMATWMGTTASFAETTTADIGDTSGLNFTVLVTGSSLLVTGSATAPAWVIKSIIKTI